MARSKEEKEAVFSEYDTRTNNDNYSKSGNNYSKSGNNYSKSGNDGADYGSE